MSKTFRVGLTRDCLKPDGSIGIGDAGLQLLDHATNVRWDVLSEKTAELGPDQIQGYDALLVLGCAVTHRTLEGADRLAIVARFGVGYDRIDVPACNDRGIMLTITPDGVRRPVASSILAFLLAISLRLPTKDRVTREGRWADRMAYNGTGLVGRVLGSIGMGNIGREMFHLAKPLDMHFMAFDPYVTPDEARELGVELVDLDTLFRSADFLTVNCPLTPETHCLVNADRLASMKPTAYLINTARGPIVDQVALTAALRDGQIQGAALDVLEQEPPDLEDPILKLDNVILAPHALAWTDQMFEGNGQSAVHSILEVAAGRVPHYVVNREVLKNPLLLAKLRSHRE